MPLSIKRSIGRDRGSPVVGSTTTKLRSISYSVKKTRRSSYTQRVETPNDPKRKILCCKRCRVTLNPKNLKDTLNGCKCTRRSNSIKSVKKVCNTKPKLKTAKDTNSSKVASGSTGNDYKLLHSPKVVIESSLRMLAEAAAMKLRKGSRIGSSSRSRKESEPDNASSSGDSSSEFEDSTSDEDVFDKSKNYTSKKKTGLSTPARNRRISSASSSTGESLPDLDFPVDRRFATPSTTEIKKPVAIVSNGISEARKIISSGPGSTGLTPAKPVRQTPLVSKPRSLRSADGPSSYSESITSETTFGTPKRTVRSRLTSSNSSPDRNRLVDRPSTSRTLTAHDVEKSYSLRCLERKDWKEDTYSTLVEPTHETPVEKHATPIPPVKPNPSNASRRSRGRPRKVPESVSNPSDNVVGISKTSLTPLTRSKRRSVHSESRQSTEGTNNVTKPEAITNSIVAVNSNKNKVKDPEVPSFRSQTSAPSRNAIAVRAKQSKMMAKSRVWQSNRNNKSVWKTVQSEQNKINKPIPPDPNSILKTTDLQPNKSVPTVERGNGEFRNQLKILPPQATASRSKPVEPPVNISRPIIRKGFPVAKCVLCNMTFTRRFSLTKHYMTIQHRAMVEDAAKSSSEELLALARSVPVLSKQRVDINSLRTPGISIPVKPNLPSSSGTPSTSLLKTGHKPECVVSGDTSINLDINPDVNDDNDDAKGDDNDDNDDEEDGESGSDLDQDEIDPRFEENPDAEVEEEPTPVQEWISGHVVSRQDFLCDVCQERFTKKTEFAKHLWNHREESDLTCKVCGTQFTDPDVFNLHIDSAHLEDVRLKCTYCPSQFNRQEYLDKHLLSHKRDLNDRFICSQCDRRFSTHFLLSKHFDSKHLLLGSPRVKLARDSPHGPQPKIPESIDYDNINENEDSPLSSCDEIYPEFRDQMPDIDLENQDLVQPAANSSSENEPTPMIPPEDYGREIPVQIFQSYQGFKSSKKKALDVGFARFGSGYKYRLPSPFTQGDGNPERFTCYFCHERFKYKTLLSRHMLKHVSEKDFFKVNPGAVKKSIYINHRTKQVAKKLPRLLPILPNDLGHSVQVKSGATGLSKPAPVTVQMAGIEQSPNLNFHMAVSKPSTTGGLRQIGSLFSCSLCNESFTEKQTLTVHTWFHQKENVHSCPDCDARCERKSDLDLHYKCHETQQPFFLCYVCFKPFRWKKDMIRHVRKKHPAERTYRCLYCPERFRKNEELTLHISRRHPEHRSFPCEYCGRRYAQKRYLLVHIQTQHGVEPVAENVHQLTFHTEEDEEEMEDDEDNIFLDNDHDQL